MKLWIRREDLERIKDPNFNTDVIRLFAYKPVYEAVELEITEVGADGE